MKTIGLLGGTSYPSTFLYYNLLNKLVNEKLGAFHSAKIILHSIDYDEIKQCYNQPDGWDKIPFLLKEQLDVLLSLPIDGFMICNNTLHKAYDILQSQNVINHKIPLFHALDLCTKQAVACGYRKVLLLGTKFTMTDSFFKRYFRDHSIEVIVPTETEMDMIQTIQTKTSLGKHTLEECAYFNGLLENYRKQVDTIILGCTELPLLLNQPHRFKVINPIELQCKHAIEFMLN